ncbi:MAG TPA: aminoacyl-tRNA hydrolase, partial [Bacilli bacterium]|nr:aminoacyl-tRNA hydrolase [Bacilli bacterium]
GEVIKKFVDYYNINISDIFVISDDLDLSVGNYRLRASGSSGGHNGLKNIEENLQTDEYKRLRIGISNNKNINTKDYVLGKMDDEDRKIINKVIGYATEIIDDYLTIPFAELMSKYNKKQ